MCATIVSLAMVSHLLFLLWNLLSPLAARARRDLFLRCTKNEVWIFSSFPTTLINMANFGCTRRRASSILACLFLLVPYAAAWPSPGSYSRRLHVVRRMNFLSDLGDMMTGGKLVAQESLPYGDPLGDISENQRTFAVQERAISFTGEDFDVFDAQTNEPYCRVRGAMLHLPGKDKMRIRDTDGNVKAVLDRKLVSMKPTYDIYRQDGGEKIGWIEKATFGFTDTFDFYAQSEAGGIGPFAAPPAYKLEGDFLDRRFVMKNNRGEVVAKVSMDRLIEFDAFNHYQIQVAPGMDSTLAIACACAIDEEFDEEHKKRKEEREAS